MKNMKSMYVNLAIMAVLSFISMFVFMYMMVDSFANVYPNINQIYMAGLMTAPMIVIEIFVMWSMYNNKKANLVIAGVSVLLLILFTAFIRYQTLVGDKQFLKSMIPHHAGAILMCDNPNLRDQEIKDLCKSITIDQQKEIDWMKNKLDELERKQ
ncbi:MAG: DUF305 domain-containing protein [Chloracidobacterium sp.]|nr:DUF305 domain-containing protein [Chloracidobacterium sp.]MCC7307418.1 DUF305 domain-containing protein [Acidobacteriota bacterium]